VSTKKYKKIMKKLITVSLIALISLTLSTGCVAVIRPVHPVFYEPQPPIVIVYEHHGYWHR
jgi:hypothetical protein